MNDLGATFEAKSRTGLSASGAPLWILGAIALGLGAFSACGAPAPTLDRDGDKVADDLGRAVDIDGDGEPDPFDFDGDGKADGIGVDTDGDNRPDAIGLDTDGDGIIDALDTDGDGRPDKISSPPQQDGSSDDLTFDDPNEEEGCARVLPVIFRDFTAAHPDFEMEFMGDGVRIFLVNEELGADQKPVYNAETQAESGRRGDGIGCAPGQESNCASFPTRKVITSQETFDQWYRTDPAGKYNVELPGRILLRKVEDRLYEFDSNDEGGFFPLNVEEGFGESPVGLGKNFLFTTEIHLNFQYVPGQVFNFRGDDDLWIFVNGKLAMDLGGMHNPAEGSIDFDAQAARLGLIAGKSYPMDVFHAERHTYDSNFRLTTNIDCFRPVVITK